MRAEHLAEPIHRALVAIWAGALWTVGYLVAPTLFGRLGDPVLAGEIAGWLFERVAQVGLVCGVLLLLLRGRQCHRVLLREPTVWLVLALMAASAVQWQVLQPMMHALKATTDVTGGSGREAFGRLHAIAGVLYLAQSVAALALVALPPWRAARV
ncbi:MAG: DUF4149 domain-containing protein [Rhodocyclaceae bacterium]|nr:DUF4149 domain-containing protein [Rhodocyclaceae bacterium]